MSPEERLDIQHACERLINEFGRLVDDGHPDRVGELFSEDGVLQRAGAVATGRDEIAASIAPVAAGTARMHLYCNVSVDVESKVTATAQYYYLAYKLPTDPISEDIAPSVIGRIVDRFKLTGEGWRISRRVQSRIASR